MENLHPGLVVIGGLNRAGKTTLMHVLRYLAYGFPQGEKLPPPNNRYEVEADLKAGSLLYNLGLSGFGRPVLRLLSAEGATENIENLYGLDGFTYRQLFTISLDELRAAQNLAGESQRRLRSVLLGAGLQDALIMPQLARTFYDAGDKIGGRRGKSDVRSFKPYYNNIKGGQKLKRAGLAQAQKYGEKQAELELTKSQISKLTQALEGLDARVLRLDVIKNNFENYIKLREWEEELEYRKDWAWPGGPGEYEIKSLVGLQEEYLTLKQNLREKEIEFGLEPSTKERLLQEQEEFASLHSQASGIAERLRLFQSMQDDLAQMEQHLQARIKETNSDWTMEQAAEILAIKTDHAEQHRLAESVQTKSKLVETKRTEKEALQRLAGEEEVLKREVADLKKNAPQAKFKSYFYFSLGILVLGLVLSFVNLRWGIWLTAGGLALAGGYLITNLQQSGSISEVQRRQKERLLSVQADLVTVQNRLKALDGKLLETEGHLAHFKKAFGLPSEVQADFLLNHLTRLGDLQERIVDRDRLTDKLREEEDYLEKQFLHYSDFLLQFAGLPDLNEADFLEKWRVIKIEFDKLQSQAVNARELKALEDKAEDKLEGIFRIMGRYEQLKIEGEDEISEAIADFQKRGRQGLEFLADAEKAADLGRSMRSSLAADAVKWAFLGAENEQDVLEQFKKECGAYGTQSQVEQAYQQAFADREEIKGQLEAKREVKRRLEAELEQLSSPEDLQRGQQLINHNRKQLKILAEEYALMMSAAFLLREAEKALLREMKDSIMAGAGQIFQRLTEGFYEGILPAESLLTGDFTAVLQGGANSQAVDMLSRGTQEQLYLAVRLSRILEIEPHLPIIIDDSFANFDSHHLDQSVHLLAEIAQTHQIFILTCHSRLLENIEQLGSEVQYWKLAEGRFKASGYKELRDHLSLY